MKLIDTCSFKEVKASLLSQNTELFSELLGKSGIESVFKMTDDNGETILHIACRVGNVRAVLAALENDADIDAKNNKSANTPLHIAIRNGNFVIIMHLLNNGASVKEKNVLGNTPLHEAILCRAEKKVLKKLIEHYQRSHALEEGFNCVNNEGKTPLNIAVEILDTEAANTLVSLETALTGKTGLLSAYNTRYNSPETGMFSQGK